MKPHIGGLLTSRFLAAALCVVPLLSGCYNDIVSEPPSKRGGLLPVAGAYNVRDLGIYKTADGKKIKSGKLIRSGDLNLLTSRDQDYLFGELGIKTVVDFRGKLARTDGADATISERAAALDLVRNDVTVLYEDTAIEESLMIQSYEDVIQKTKTEAEAITLMANGYKALLTGDDPKKNAKAQFKAFFAALLAAEGNPVLFHCSAGKDRTGIASILLLSALGVDQATIKNDYLSSAEFVAEKYHPVPNIVSQATAAEMKTRRDSEDVQTVAGYLNSDNPQAVMGAQLKIQKSIVAGIREGVIANLKAGMVNPEGTNLAAINAMDESALNAALKNATPPTTVEQAYQYALYLEAAKVNLTPDAYIAAIVKDQCDSIKNLAKMSDANIDAFAAEAKKKIAALVTVKETYFTAVYEAAGNDIVAYLKSDLGLTDENIAQLKSLYLEN